MSNIQPNLTSNWIRVCSWWSIKWLTGREAQPPGIFGLWANWVWFFWSHSESPFSSLLCGSRYLSIFVDYIYRRILSSDHNQQAVHKKGFLLRARGRVNKYRWRSVKVLNNLRLHTRRTGNLFNGCQNIFPSGWWNRFHENQWTIILIMTAEPLLTNKHKINLFIF